MNKINEINWIKFSDEMPHPFSNIYVTDHVVVNVLTWQERQTDQFKEFHKNYDLWAYVPIPKIPKKLKERHLCDDPAGFTICYENDFGNLMVKCGYYHFSVMYCPFCGYCSLEENSRIKKNTCQQENSIPKVNNLVGK